jgi:hypothetical protein
MAAAVVGSLGRARHSQPIVSPSAGGGWALVGRREHAGRSLGRSGEGRVGWVLWIFRLGMQLGYIVVEEPIGMRGWLEMEKKVGLKGGKKEWI